VPRVLKDRLAHKEPRVHKALLVRRAPRERKELLGQLARKELLVRRVRPDRQEPRARQD
jgi:hypothetical protein